MGSETAIATSIATAVEACVARDPQDPIGLFERVALLYLEQKRSEKKRPSLKFLCDEFGEWVELAVARATPQKPAARGAAYKPIEEPMRGAK